MPSVAVPTPANAGCMWTSTVRGLRGSLPTLWATLAATRGYGTCWIRRASSTGIVLFVNALGEIRPAGSAICSGISAPIPTSLPVDEYVIVVRTMPKSEAPLRWNSSKMCNNNYTKASLLVSMATTCHLVLLAKRRFRKCVGVLMKPQGSETERR